MNYWNKPAFLWSKGTIIICKIICDNKNNSALFLENMQYYHGINH